MFRRAALAALVAAVLSPTLAWAYITDSASHVPPTSGAHAYYSTYGTFGPNRAGFPAKGQTFVDPVFGSTIRRLTSEVGQVSNSDIYAKNGFWNADGTRMFHNTPNGNTIINTTTGAVVRSNVPGNFDGSFAPDDPDTWYYFSGASLHKFSVATGTTSVVKTFSGTLGPLGGSIDWVDRTGRYMVLSIGGSVRVWDKQSNVLYAGALSGDVGSGWAGISPDGKYVVAAGDDKRSYVINHTTRTVNTTGVMFWSLCGDHGDLVSATDGKTYMVTFECHSDPGIWAVDITIPQTAANDTKQRADNTKLFGIAWVDEGHISAVSKGLFQDWAFVSVESNDDSFTAGVSGWRTYKQEIVMANVLTGEVRRLAHHRSRGIGGGSYYYQPRVSASWDGTRVAWASNFGYNGPDYGDIYTILVAGAVPPPPVAPSVTFANPASNAIVSGTATVTMVAAGGSGTGYTHKLTVDGITVYTGTNGTFSWNTTTVSNSSHTLVATVTDSAGRTGTASRVVTVSNAAATPPTVTFSTPATNATVSGSTTVTWAGSGGSGTGYRYTFTVDGITVYSGSNKTVAWNTTAVGNGSHTLKTTVTDSAGRTGTASRVVTVSNSATPTVTFTTPASSATVSKSTTVTMAASGGSGTGYTYTLAVDGITVYSGTSTTFAWNTMTVTNASHTLKATVTDSAAKTGTASRVVTVSNAPTVTFTTPLSNATVSASTTVSLTPSGGSRTGYTYKLAVDGITVYSGTSKTFTWNTTTVTNAAHTLKATVTDSAGKTGSRTRVVTVSNAAPPTGLVATFTSPAAGATLSGTRTIGMKVTGSTASTRTFKVYMDIYLVWQTTVTGTTASYALDTNWWAADGAHTLKLQVTDSAGKSATTTIPVTVLN